MHSSWSPSLSYSSNHERSASCHRSPSRRTGHCAQRSHCRNRAIEACKQGSLRTLPWTRRSPRSVDTCWLHTRLAWSHCRWIVDSGRWRTPDHNSVIRGRVHLNLERIVFLQHNRAEIGETLSGFDSSEVTARNDGERGMLEIRFGYFGVWPVEGIVIRRINK